MSSGERPIGAAKGNRIPRPCANPPPPQSPRPPPPPLSSSNPPHPPTPRRHRGRDGAAVGTGGDGCWCARTPAPEAPAQRPF